MCEPSLVSVANVDRISESGRVRAVVARLLEMGRSCLICRREYTGSSRSFLPELDVDALKSLGHTCKNIRGERFYAHDSCVARAENGFLLPKYRVRSF